jgi:hypothetical protein
MQNTKDPQKYPPIRILDTSKDKEELSQNNCNVRGVEKKYIFSSTISP